MPTQKDDADPNSPQLERPPDDLPPPGNGNGNGNGHPRPVRINQVSPVGGALAGGADVTLTGTGFQPDAEVFFGSNSSPQVTFNSSTSVTAKSPPAEQTGTVSVTIVNPDGTTATRANSFTYVRTEASLHAEVLGVSPLSVIEDTESEITIRGRNLIAAFNDGIIILRGPSRVNITSSNFGNSTDAATGIESLTLTVRVVATPPLEQHERIGVQVLASIRPGAANDGVFETSRQMFTVLPRAVPVMLAYTQELIPNRPNLVVVAGKNLKGYSLSLGKTATLHAQNGDDETLSAIVSFTARGPVPKSVPLTVLDPDGGEVGRFDVSVAEKSPEEAASAEAAEVAPGESAPTDPGTINLTLTPVPGQQLTGPTSQDSAVFGLRGESLSSFAFNFFDFEFTIFELDIIIPLFNEVRLIPFFDNGIGDVLNDTPVIAEVGKLFRLRGMGILVALRVDLFIHIEVVLIISFRFSIWDFGLFNEFPEFGWAIGSIVISIRIIIQVFLLIAFLVALVKPGGHLRVLFFFNLTLGIDFTISTDGRHLRFDRNFIHQVDYTKVSPLHMPFLCDGRFQLAEENGNVAFTDGFGGSQSFYFPRAEGQCCLPWEFDLRLVRFEEGGSEEVLQENFRTEFCLNAAQPTNVVNIFITSEHPAPSGVGPTRRLTMTFDDRAKLIVMGEPADASGTPTGAPAVDITTLGYNVEFYLDPLYPDLFNPSLLPSGDAVPVQAGDNFIHARISHPGEAQLFNFLPEDVSGFEIASFIAQGLLPAILSAEILPVTVRDPTEIAITPTLAFRDPQTNQLTESPAMPFTVQGEVVREIERYEPWEYDTSNPPRPQQLDYVLAARVSFPVNTSFPIKVKFTVKSNGVKMMVLVGNNATPESKPPLENLPGGTGFGSKGPGFGSPRATDNDPTHFFAKLVQQNQSVTINFQSRPAPNELIPLKDSTSNAELTIAPNIRDEGAGHLVPPGKLVADRQVMLLIDLKAETVSVNVDVRDIKQLKLAVRNDETFEEYLRVFPDVRTILTGDFRDFPKGFYGRLPAEGPPSADLLDTEGKRLWNLACTQVQTTRDDRPLYWARLQTIGALRAYYKRNRLGQPDVTQFEWPSRGLELDGSISFEGVTNPRKAIFTGFDPFGLIFRPSSSEPHGSLFLNRSNPSGLAALDFNKKSFGSASALVDVRTAIFPVRYDDFDHNLIEKAVTPNLGSIVLLMTCSDNSGRDFYDVERWAGKMRGNDILDNNRRAIDGPAGGVSEPGGAAASGPQFLESTLPYELVIATPTDTLPGPERPDTPFVMDQSYRIVGATTQEEGKLRFSPEPSDPIIDRTAWFTKLPERPLATATAAEGSGGNYLSNEIFYRSALVRQSGRPALPSGHLHVPSTETDPTGKGPALISGVRAALNRLLAAALRPRLRSATDLKFTDTLINASRTLTLTAANDTTETITVNTAEVAQPFTVQLPSPPPIPLSPGDTLSLTLTFTPTAEAQFIRAVQVRNTNGDLVLACTLVGKGVQTLPTPQITSFDPASGQFGDDVTINGTNLDGATAVRIGGGSVGFAPVSPNEITATVTPAARTGHIEVQTPSERAVSTGTFFVIRRPPPPEDLAAQLKARREELELTPREAAEQIGASSGTYRRWERGDDRPSARYHAAVVSFLGHDPDPSPKEFGERIRAARERDGLTRSQLAQHLGLAASTVRSWETGEVSRPTPRVANIFGDYVKEE